MAQETIHRIRKRIEHAHSIAEEDRRALADLLSQLEAEVDNLPEAHLEEIRTVVGFAEVSAHEAMRERSEPEVMNLALRGMRTSVDRLQEKHPALVAAVLDFAAVLARMGF